MAFSKMKKQKSSEGHMRFTRTLAGLPVFYPIQPSRHTYTPIYSCTAPHTTVRPLVQLYNTLFSCTAPYTAVYITIQLYVQLQIQLQIQLQQPSTL